MKNAPEKTTFESAPEKADSNMKFIGTDNPRHIRAIAALMARPQRREQLDAVAGCSNSPELVAELRRRGLSVPCQRVHDIDRDGLPIRRGVYYFIDTDKKKIHEWRSGNLHE